MEFNLDRKSFFQYEARVFLVSEKRGRLFSRVSSTSRCNFAYTSTLLIKLTEQGPRNRNYITLFDDGRDVLINVHVCK